MSEHTPTTKAKLRQVQVYLVPELANLVGAYLTYKGLEDHIYPGSHVWQHLAWTFDPKLTFVHSVSDLDVCVAARAQVWSYFYAGANKLLQPCGCPPTKCPTNPTSDSPTATRT